MNNFGSEAVVTERRSHLKVLLIIFSFALIFALYQLYIMNKSNVGVPPLIVESEITSYGLDAPLDAGYVPTGTIYFSAVFASSSQPEPLLYGYNMAQNNISFLSDISQKSASAFGTSSVISIMPIDEYGASDSYQPQMLNLIDQTPTPLKNSNGHSVKDLTVSPDGSMYAYSYQDLAGVESPEPQILSGWNIAIHSFNTETVITIPSANQPEWINNGAQLVYLTDQGINRYDIATQKSDLLFTSYAPYTDFDDIAVSPNSQSLILTKPNTNLVSVLSFEGGKLTELGRMVSTDTTYTQPVIAPDSRHYVMLGEKLANLKINNYETFDYAYDLTYKLELRQIDNAEVLIEVPLIDVATSSIDVSNWNDRN